VVTTTETLKQRSPVLCEMCHKEARGGVLVGRADGRMVGECHAGSSRALFQSMIGSAPEPDVLLPIIVAADPFEPRRGASKIALKVLGAIRVKHAQAKSREEAQRYAQAHPAVVAEVLADGVPAPLSEPLNVPSIPPPAWAGPDPLLAGIRPPLRSGRMARRETRPGPLDAVGHDGRVDHVSPREAKDRAPWSERDAGAEEELG
jgi:hypothetical protein